jgi:6-phosphogluconolactonase (cycloisomerase 2 family)
MKQKAISRSKSLRMIAFSVLSGLLLIVGTQGGAEPVLFHVALQPQAQYAYVSNNGSDDVTVYQVNPSTGQLQPVGTAQAGSGPQAVAVAPAVDPSLFAVTGQPVYVVNQDSNTISMYTVNPANGQLTPVGQPAPTGDSPQAIAVTPQGDMAIVTNSDSNTISTYQVSPTNGNLTPMQMSVPAGQDPVAVAVNPSGSMAFVANQGGGKQGSPSISVYSINQNTHTVSPMGQPVPMPVGVGAPSSVDVVPFGNQTVVVATAPATNNMGVFVVNPLPLPGSPALLPVGAFSVGGNNPTSIDIGDNGIAAVSLTGGGGPGKRAAQGFTAVALFRITSAGATLLGPPAITPGGSGPTDVAVDPGGGFAYVTNRETNNVSVFAIMPSGFAMPMGQPVPAGTSPQGIAVAN